MKTELLEKLSALQEQKIPEYINYWGKVATRTKTIHQDSAILAMNFIYDEILKYPKPKQVFFFSSPVDAHHACNEMGGGCLDMKKVRRGLLQNLEKHLADDLSMSLAVEVYSQFYKSLRMPFGAGLNASDAELREALDANGLHYCEPGWSNLDWAELCQYAFFHFLLNEVFPEKRTKLSWFESFTRHFAEFHQCWIFQDMAFVCDFPLAYESSGAVNA